MERCTAQVTIYQALLGSVQRAIALYSSITIYQALVELWTAPDSNW